MTINVNLSVSPDADYQAEVDLIDVDKKGKETGRETVTVVPATAYMAAVYPGREVLVREVPLPETKEK